MFQLQCSYLPFDNFLRDAERQKAGLLGALCFSRDGIETVNVMQGMPLTEVPMTCLNPVGATFAACEAWHAGGRLNYGTRARVHYGHNESILFGTIQLPEEEFDTPALRESGKTPLQMASEFAYRSIFELTQALEFPVVFRFWNYLADINGETHGMERYRQFNMGRQDGFLARGQTVAESVPAASAVGFESGPLTVCFLAGRGVAPVFVENPRQVSAYRYPSEYGPCSPTFSRANVVRLDGEAALFISGTASIVGHRTLHAGDVIGQTRETLANVEALIGEARRLAPGTDFALEKLCCKVYLRHAEHLAQVREELHRALGPSAKLLFLRADICRSDLLIEIEATAGHPLSFAMPA